MATPSCSAGVISGARLYHQNGGDVPRVPGRAGWNPAPC